MKDEKPSEQEILEAEQLAKESGPQDALETVGLLKHACQEPRLSKDQIEQVWQDVQQAAARKPASRTFRFWLVPASCLLAGATAVLLFFGVPSHQKAGLLNPPASLFKAQLKSINGDEKAWKSLQEKMHIYRKSLLTAMEKRY
jgi:hypothetical protein